MSPTSTLLVPPWNWPRWTPSPGTATGPSTRTWPTWSSRSNTPSAAATAPRCSTATGCSTPPWSRPPAAPGSAAFTGSFSKSSASPWHCPSAPEPNSAAPRTTTGSCSTRCAAAGNRPGHSSPHTCKPVPPSCNGCSTCSPKENSPTAKKARHLVADRSTSGRWDLIVAPWHLDEHIPAFPIPAGVAETIRPDLPPGPAPGRMSLLHRAVAERAVLAARPLLLTGDCTTARAAVAGLQRRHRDLAVVWLDAHGDFNTPAITISGYLGGMALAMLTGRTPGLFGDALGLRPVPDASVVLADARDLDPAERDALTASGVRRVPADPAMITSALDGLGRTPVYLHLDVDVIGGTQLPGLRF